MQPADSQQSTPTASKIMVIRHAEKPASHGAPHGVTDKGKHDKESLTVQGWQRAGALANLFAPGFAPMQHPGLARPEHLYASAIARHSNSERPEETITPLSDKTSLKIDTRFDKQEYADMARAAMRRKGIVLICWEHQDIPAIANIILGNRNTAPQTWPGERFDLVWVFDLDESSRSYQFRQVPQCLLAGDSASMIAD